MKKSGSRPEGQKVDSYVIEYDGIEDSSTDYIHVDFLTKHITINRIVHQRPNMDFLDAKIIDLIFVHEDGKDEIEGLHYRFFIESGTPTEISASWYETEMTLRGEYVFEFTEWEIV